jgi:ATP-dependent DNA ligase
MYAFDLLELNGKDLRRESWETRRGALTRLLGKD